MFRIGIDKAKSNADRKLREVAVLIEKKLPFFKSWGNAVARMGRNNALAKGGRRFWRSVADRVRLKSATDSEAVVSCDHAPGVFKETGGVHGDFIIRPKNKRALTIPISDEAKGKTVAEFELGGHELFPIKAKGPETKGILAYLDAGGNLHPLFALRTKAQQKPDQWWSDDASVSAAGLKEAQFWLDRQLGRQL